VSYNYRLRIKIDRNATLEILVRDIKDLESILSNALEIIKKYKEILGSEILEKPARFETKRITETIEGEKIDITSLVERFPKISKQKLVYLILYYSPKKCLTLSEITEYLNEYEPTDKKTVSVYLIRMKSRKHLTGGVEEGKKCYKLTVQGRRYVEEKILGEA